LSVLVLVLVLVAATTGFTGATSVFFFSIASFFYYVLFLTSLRHSIIFAAYSSFNFLIYKYFSFFSVL